VSAVVHRVAVVLREAGEDGLTLAEIETAVGTRWALRVIGSMNRNGYAIGEQNGRYFLVSEPDVERTASTSSVGANGAVTPTAEGDAGLIPRASADGSLSVEQALFELPPLSAIDPLADAA
jgi:squalene cyclase